MNGRRAGAAAGILVLLLVPVAVFAGQAESGAEDRVTLPPVSGGRLPIQGEGGIGAASQDFTGELIQVLERDAIQAVDHPPFVSADSRSASVYQDDEHVIGIEIAGRARAYPLRVLSVHEVVNDTIAGKPVIITFCPLCYTGVAFDREVDGDVRDFGVSGVLLNSNLVLYDRQSGTLWSQLTGEAVGGPQRGDVLRRIPSRQLAWSDWRRLHPDTEVLDLDALGGEDRYPAQRFIQYFGSSARGLIPLGDTGELDGKEMVLGLRLGTDVAAYPLKVHAGRAVNDVVGGQPVIVVADLTGASGHAFRRPDADIELRLSQDRQVLIAPSTGERWDVLTGEALDDARDLEPLDTTVSFWFAWRAFSPESRIVIDQ